MPVNTTALDAAIAALTIQVDSTETVEASAIALISGFAVQIIAAVAADNAIDQANTDRVTAIVESVKVRFNASSENLAEAITANTPSA